MKSKTNKQKETNELIFKKRNRLTGIENKLMVTKQKRGEGINLENEINRCIPTVFKIGKQEGFMQ